MIQDIMTVAETAKLIEAGNVLLLAGDEAVLRQLPKGNWIGGTIPYFISHAEGGLATRDRIFVTDVTGVAQSVEIVERDANGLAKVYAEGPQEGFSVVIIPALSKAHLSFALNAPNYKDFGVRPLIGWISGVHLDDLGKVTPKVFNGVTGNALEEGAVVLQATLKPGKVAEVGIVNLFEQGGGDILTFPADGFSAKEVLVNGEKRNFAAYIVKNKLDTRLPLVADYYGALVNISFQGIDEVEGEVKFYAPVFTGIRYKHAKPVADYGEAFKACLENKCQLSEDRVVFSCNCILNYLYSGLEGKKTDPFVGPITFGEIAYQLLNQTLVYLEVHDV
ncbi:DUF6976 family protein [Fundidesulfovibrio agrisoli]|uniref:DUF6976 family protein n=1 Tax=Fundidesulfovibrio agrisoli TaxID=2922717 RepID=UPI001FADC49A|nr:hypothetical protein [Fundidesulfovibrio agrisoli]